MSEDKLDATIIEIDKSKRRQKTDDSIATAAMNGVDDTLQSAKMENGSESAGKPTELLLQASAHLISSTTSSLADTPGDSGVLCLDSEGSEVAGQALMTHSLVGAEELVCDSQCDPIPGSSQDMTKSTTSSLMTRSDFDNSNITIPDDMVPELVESHSKSPICENLPDVVLKALEQEKLSPKDTDKPSQRTCEPKKSLSEDIVYRRRCRKKSQSGPSSQKKRVSFHEDILNNTRTDNIHIERGFVSYAPNSSYCDRFREKNSTQSDRFSWCASGDKTQNFGDDVGQQTMSEILTYGDCNNDKSGVFEYSDSFRGQKSDKSKDNNTDAMHKRKLYGCDSNSSDSNFSCDSETSSTDSTSSNSKTEATLAPRKDKAQKSYSCDGFDNSHVSFMRKTYFSEADIDQNHDRTNKPLEVSESPNRVKSVLKKKRYITTNVVEEGKQSKKIINLLDANNIIGSLKSFYRSFNFKLTPEKGVSEMNADLNNVVEAFPTTVNENKNLSKSLDSGLHIEDEDFIEINLNDQPVLECPVDEKPKEMTASVCSIASEKPRNEGSPRHKLTLNMKSDNGMNTTNKAGIFPPLSKYVVNSESTVYEHTGVSYSFVHDTFQTAFDAPKQSFVPLPDSTPVREMSNSSSKQELSIKTEDDASSKTSTPKRQFNKNILDEKSLKAGIPKHLSSPKKQNFSKLCRKSASMLKVNDETAPGISDNISNADNSTLKGGEDLIDEYFDSPSNQKLQSSKSAMLNRYLKNVCQKKDLELKIKNNKFFQDKLLIEKHFPSIIYPLKTVSETFHESAQRMARLISKEVVENKRLSIRLLTAEEPSYFDSFEDNVAMECSEKLRLQIFTYPNETLNRMMKVQSQYDMSDGSWTPLLVFITDYAFYLASLKEGGTEYEILCKLPHSELDTIAIGPDNQSIQIVDVAGNTVCSLVTPDANLCSKLVGSLEWSARCSPIRPASPPAAIRLTCNALVNAVAKQRAEKIIPQVVSLSWCVSGEATGAPHPAGAFAPPLEGHLMCKVDKTTKFEPYYFLLRAGTLQYSAACGGGPASLPLRLVRGVRRVAGVRPHCFELLADGRALVLAAPHEEAASAWLQSLLVHAAQALEDKSSPVPPPSPPPAVSVLVTDDDVISLRHSYDRMADAESPPSLEILACGSIKNLTAFKIPDNDENWCTLEWSVCEASERGSGLSLLLGSAAELDRLLGAVELAHGRITNQPFPLMVVEGSRSVVGAAYASYEAAWNHMLPAQQ